MVSTLRSTLLPAIALIGMTASVSAQTIYSTGFENPPFVNGSVLSGQDGWIGRFSPNAPILSNSAARTGSQGVQVRFSDLDQFTLDPYYTALGSYRRPVNYDVAAHGYPIVHISADVRLDGPLTPPLEPRPNDPVASGPFAWANLETYSDSGVPFGGLGFWSDGHVYAFDGPTIGPETVLGSLSVTPGTWHTLEIDIDVLHDTHTFLVDGVSLGMTNFQNAGTSDVLQRASLVTYTNLLAGDRDAYTAFYDNVTIDAVPEPGTQALLFTSGVISATVLFHRRKARRP